MLHERAPYRVLRIARVAAAAMGRYQWLTLRERFGPAPTPQDWERAHERTARALHDLGIGLGGLFVKVCQVVGARADVFPAPFVRQLGRFHDRVPPRPFDELRPHIEREMGLRLEAAFSQVDPTPLAAASLAQVHRATRRDDGSEVVIKVQYPEIARLAKVDLWSLRRAVRVAAWLQPRVDLRSLVDELADFVGLELDFAREAASTERVRTAFAGDSPAGRAGDSTVRVPRVHADLSSPKLLVLEYLDGIKITDVERLRAAGHDLRQVAERVAQAYVRMIFEQGFFQGDPHPGNLLVLADGAIGLLDFGLAKELPAGFADAIAAMLMHGLTGNGPLALAAARAAGFEVGDNSAAAFPALVLTLFGDRESESELTELLEQTPLVRIPSHFALIARVLVLLNGLSHTLAPGEMLIQRPFIEALGARAPAMDGDLPTQGLPPGPDESPMLQALRWVRWPLPMLEACARRYGDAFTLRFPGRPPLVLFSHPDAIRELFTGDDDVLRAGAANGRLLEPILGSHSLLLLDGREHLAERRLLQPPFHGERMQAYGETMQQIAARAIDRWPLGRPFRLHPRMQEITLDVILRTVFGLREGGALERLRAGLIELLAVATNPSLLLAVAQTDGKPSLAVSRAQQLRTEVDAQLYAEIARRRAGGTAGRDDVLSLLLDARDEQDRGLGDRELRDELMTLLLAGHETSATTLAWAVQHLLAHPEIRERLRAELAGLEKPLDPQAVARLEWLDATVKETLRLTPIVPNVGRFLAQPVRIGGWDLPAGVVAAPSIYLAHHRPERWPEPTRFDPARFVGTRPSPYEFLPFGGGVRRCIGAAFALYEIKIVLAQVLTRVELRAADGYAVRVVRRAVTLAPSEGMPVVATARAA